MMNVLAIDQTAMLARDRRLYRLLLEEGKMEITLLVPRRWQDEFGSSRPEPESSKLNVISGRVIFPGRSHRALYPALPRILRALRPSILYVNAEPESYVAWHAVRSRDRCSPGTKVVFMSWRNIDYHDGSFPYKFAFLNARAERTVLSNADHCIAHNRSAKEILASKGFLDVTVIPAAVDTALFKRTRNQSLRTRLGLTAFTVGYAGRVIAEKGIDHLLQAVANLTFPCQVLIVGDGPAMPVLKRLARGLKIDRSVVWAGAVRHDAVPEYLSLMDAMVLPSRTGQMWKEQFGRVLIEAMACQVPVVASRSGEIPEVVGDAGILFAEGDAPALTQALEDLHRDDRLRKDQAERGLYRVTGHFTVERIAEEYARLFRSLCNAWRVDTFDPGA